MGHRTQQPHTIGTPDRTYLLLLDLADRLTAKHATHAVDEPLVLAQALVVTEAMYGSSAWADTVERKLVDSLPPIRPGDTRDVYAARLRLIAEGATA
ncbi:hypothetical protein [Streptomyces sp. NBC_01268]|uniref:hypothetical protein n=1 Tax=Streptomyces sp. NBC_01268 TaxID=2903806 RepID=UPI002E334ED0|nr:hypothetical protein [Streptomyces sp. NBC_01268]